MQASLVKDMIDYLKPPADQYRLRYILTFGFPSERSAVLFFHQIHILPHLSQVRVITW